MQKALAQNPNLLRTLLGLSFTLIFLLGYAVYGATVSPSYYVYETETLTTRMKMTTLRKSMMTIQTLQHGHGLYPQTE